MAKLQISVDTGIEYVPTRKVRKFSEKQRVEWPFARMQSGDSFVIPENYTLSRAHGAWSRFKIDNPDYKDWGMRSQESDNGTIRVWIFSPSELSKYPSVN